MSKSGYFAASNSGQGFKNYYEEIFGDSDRIFVIKGGPGTGKSRFMSEVAEYATARGRKCERYYCSSDPNSLDGIRLCRDRETISVIDGTPPHAWEPRLPGVRDEIVNLGEFWNDDLLRQRSDEIKTIDERKSELWREAYRWLSGSLDMCESIKRTSVKYIDGSALCDVAEDILKGIDDGEEFKTQTALISSVGMYGRVSLGEYFARADELYIVKDYFISGHILLTELLALARKKKLSVRISYDPVDAERMDGIFFDRSRLCVVVSDASVEREYKSIDMRDLCHIDGDGILSVKYAERVRVAMLDGACDTLEEINRLHFELEKIYSTAMDFEAKEAFTRGFCKKIFGL